MCRRARVFVCPHVRVRAHRCVCEAWVLVACLLALQCFLTFFFPFSHMAFTNQVLPIVCLFITHAVIHFYLMKHWYVITWLTNCCVYDVAPFLFLQYERPKCITHLEYLYFKLEFHTTACVYLPFIYVKFKHTLP